MDRKRQTDGHLGVKQYDHCSNGHIKTDIYQWSMTKHGWIGNSTYWSFKAITIQQNGLLMKCHGSSSKMHVLTGIPLAQTFYRAISLLPVSVSLSSSWNDIYLYILVLEMVDIFSGFCSKQLFHLLSNILNYPENRKSTNMPFLTFIFYTWSNPGL